MEKKIVDMYVKILEEELKPALGCTEPIAISFLAASIAHYMQALPQTLLIEASGNIIKNAKSVVVPNTNGMKGIIAAAAAGFVAGDAEAGLEVLKNVSQKDFPSISAFINEASITLKKLESSHLLHIKMQAMLGDDVYIGELCDQHTNITQITKNGDVLYSSSGAGSNSASAELTDRSVLNVKDILIFADSVDLDRLSHFIEKQIEYNTKICKKGLTDHYGIDIGQNLLRMYSNETSSLSIRMKAIGEATAASDARMCGCPLPVMTNSGSGNQGLTVSIPVIVYARELKKSKEELYRALIVSNLLAIHSKTAIGRLSAYCGAVTAASASASAITYMLSHSYDTVCKTLTTSLATTSGMFCDGAKQSCSNKIATALNTALFAHDMALRSLSLEAGDGIIKDDIEATIKGIGKIASKGMVSTDKVILDVMLE